MKYIKKLLVQYLTRKLLKAVSSEDIITITSRGWVTENRTLTQEERQQIKMEAQDLADSTLWKYLSKELEYAAFVRGRKATNDEDNMACHYMFYNLDLIEQFLERCRKL